MKLDNLLNFIDSNQEQISKLKVANKLRYNKLLYELQLDLNYHSNAIEGSPLTKEQTKQLMAGLLLQTEVEKKYLEEMKGHNSLVEEILNAPLNQLQLTTANIKSMHKKIMYENNSARKREIGNWKSHDNYVINYRKEEFKFVSVDFVEGEMKHICKALAFDMEDSDTHPVELAAKFHLDFIEIHPFYDGNGRMARALSNLILVNYGFLPCVIETKQKAEYFQVLADIQSYGSGEELFYCFFAECVIHTQNQLLEGLQSSVATASNDFTNRLELLNEKLKNLSSKESSTIDKKIVEGLIEGWFSELVKQLLLTSKLFEQFFTEPSHCIQIKWEGVEVENQMHDYLQTSKWLKSQISGIKSFNKEVALTMRLLRNKELKKIKSNAQELVCKIELVLLPTHYELSTQFNDKHYQFENRIYHKKIMKEEINSITRTFRAEVLEFIEAQYKVHETNSK